VSLARRPQPAASSLHRDEARRIDDVRAAGSPVARRCGGDEDIFLRLIGPYRPALHAHCYRMLGSLHDAEDAVQSTLLRAWRALPKFRGESSLRTWLYRIATNVCLDAIARRPQRVLPVDYGPATGPPDAHEKPLSVARALEWYPYETLGGADGDSEPETRYERREALELALTTVLHNLPARQRAALILRDVLGFSAKEAAESLETTVPGVNGAVLRARQAVEGRLPEPSQQASPRTLGDRRLRAIVERFVDAFERGEVNAILAMLAEEAKFAKRTAGAPRVESLRRRGLRPHPEPSDPGRIRVESRGPMRGPLRGPSVHEAQLRRGTGESQPTRREGDSNGPGNRAARAPWMLIGRWKAEGRTMNGALVAWKAALR